MSAEARYFRVGLFVFLGMAALAAFALLLGGEELFAKPILIETYIDESVTGLEVGSPLRLRGVQIGSVSKIAFVTDRYRFASEGERLKYGQLVRVVMEMTPPQEVELTPTERRKRIEALIAEGLRMRLTSQGITGVSFIQADFLDAERYPPMVITWEPVHYYVPSAPSTIAAISSAAERIMSRLENVKVEDMVKNLDVLLVTLNEKVEKIDTGELAESIEKLIASLRRSLRGADVPAVAKDARGALAQVDATLVRVQRMIDGGQYDLQVTLENLRVTSENLRDLTESLRSQPSLLLRGTAPEDARLPK